MIGWLKGWWSLGVARRARHLKPQTMREYIDAFCVDHQKRYGCPPKMTFNGRPISRDDLPYLEEDEIKKIIVHDTPLEG